MDGYPSDWSLICVAIGYQLLQLQSSSTNETESWAHRARAIHVAFPQGPQGVGIVEGDPTLLKVETHTEPGGQGVGEARGRGGAVVSRAVPVVVVAVVGQVDLTHAHSEEAERRSRVQVIFCTAVVAAVWVVPESAQIKKDKQQRPPTTDPFLYLVLKYDIDLASLYCVLAPLILFFCFFLAASHRGLAMSCGR